MDRRAFLKGAASVPFVAAGCSSIDAGDGPNAAAPFTRVRPGDASWPSDAAWEQLRGAVGGRLIRVESAPDPAYRNPFSIGDNVALTQTSGWVGAWTSSASVYAVAAESPSDVVAAVNFARDHDLRLVIKGGGHSYQGTSNAPDSLLVWTRRMNGVTLHDSFVPRGCEADMAQPAVSIGAGAMWGQVYDAVTTRGGRYVQGGGCTTVGVAGLIQSGGFGSFSKRFGLAAPGCGGDELRVHGGRRGGGPDAVCVPLRLASRLPPGG